MFIPNHTSFLDIFSMSGFVPRRMKYISKIEILRIPLIGWAMQFAGECVEVLCGKGDLEMNSHLIPLHSGHIAIRRMDRRSQMQTFKDAITTLENGNSVVTFAEGTRSKDGKLKKFKKGPFKMSSKAGVRIIPVSICNMYRWMPSSALLPVAFPRQVEIKLHAPVETAGRDEAEVSKEVFGIINRGLPPYQQAAPGAVV